MVYIGRCRRRQIVDESVNACLYVSTPVALGFAIKKEMGQVTLAFQLLNLGVGNLVLFRI